MGWKEASKSFFLGLEGLLQWLLRRGRPRHAWRRKNGRRWVLEQ